MRGEELDRRSLALHRAVVARLEREPDRFAHVQAVLDRWLTTAAPATRPALEEWRRIFAAGRATALAVAVERSERGARLRQSSPFCGVLSHQERWALLRRS